MEFKSFKQEMDGQTADDKNFTFIDLLFIIRFFANILIKKSSKKWFA